MCVNLKMTIDELAKEGHFCVLSRVRRLAACERALLHFHGHRRLSLLFTSVTSLPSSHVLLPFFCHPDSFHSPNRRRNLRSPSEILSLVSPPRANMSLPVYFLKSTGGKLHKRGNEVAIETKPKCIIF